MTNQNSNYDKTQNSNWDTFKNKTYDKNKTQIVITLKNSMSEKGKNPKKYFGKNNLTPQQLMRCTWCSLLKSCNIFLGGGVCLIKKSWICFIGTLLCFICGNYIYPSK